MLKAACSETGIAPERSVMIGDTSFDMEMGKAAGFATIGVAWGYHDLARLGTAADLGRIANPSSGLDQAALGGSGSRCPAPTAC